MTANNAIVKQGVKKMQMLHQVSLPVSMCDLEVSISQHVIRLRISVFSRLHT